MTHTSSLLEKNNPSRNHEQSMGVWMNEPVLRAPESLDRSIETLADCGYGIVRLFLRNTNFTHRSPEVVALVERAVKVAHSRGLRAVLDCEPHLIVASDMGREFPEAMGSKLIRAQAEIADGHWILRVVTPDLVGGRPVFDGIEAAFLTAGGETRRIEPEFTTRAETFFYENGSVFREMIYSEGRPMSISKVITLSGELPDDPSGTLVAYVRFSGHTLPDFWADGFRDYYDSLLECYRHIPLDGVGWDEPAIDGNWQQYRYGWAFAAAFENKNGYALADQLYLLDEPGLSGEAAKVRLDYYRTLNEGLAQAQHHLHVKACELFGTRLIFGTHHTWQGEGGANDYRAGAVDYFRLNDQMDAGYTDCSWWDPQAVSYVYILGSSLGRLTPSGEAEVNTWHFKPTVANIRRNANLMTLMNITWFNIWFGFDSDCILQQGHYTWPQTVQSMQAHRQAQLTIGRKKPVVDIAIWHGWEGVCGWNSAGLASAHKTFCLNTSHLLIHQSLAADFVDSRLLAESRIEAGQLVNRLGAYKVLIVPYGLVMPRKAFDACLAFAKAGGRVVFVGTPVTLDENGKSLASDFADLFDIPEMTAADYMKGFNGSLPKSRAQRLEVCRQLSSALPNKLLSPEGEVHGVKQGETVFLTDLDPQMRLIEHIKDALEPPVEAHGRNLLWRLYRDTDEESLVVVSADDQVLSGTLTWGSKTINIHSGYAGIFTRQPSGTLSVQGDLEWH